MYSSKRSRWVLRVFFSLRSSVGEVVSTWPAAVSSSRMSARASKLLRLVGFLPFGGVDGFVLVSVSAFYSFITVSVGVGDSVFEETAPVTSTQFW